MTFVIQIAVLASNLSVLAGTLTRAILVLFTKSKFNLKFIRLFLMCVVHCFFFKFAVIFSLHCIVLYCLYGLCV